MADRRMRSEADHGDAGAASAGVAWRFRRPGRRPTRGRCLPTVAALAVPAAGAAFVLLFLVVVPLVVGWAVLPGALAPSP